MTEVDKILSADEYKNYRNVRAVAVLFILLGSVFVLAGLALMQDSDAGEKMPTAVAIGIALVGLAGALGGIAARRGSRRWAPLVYVMAALYIFAFPVGTILSYVMFTGLSSYLDSVDRIKGVPVETALFGD